MTVQTTVEFADGTKLYAVSSLYRQYVAGGCIVIPAQMANDPDLLSKVRQAVPHAHRAVIYELADHVRMSWGEARKIEDEDLSGWIAEFEELDRSMWDDQITEAYGWVRGEVARRKTARAAHAEQSEAKRQARSEVSSKYSDLFVTIGRRDGFACASCNDAAPDLQIDHVVPVSRGGGSDLDNLQLLCPGCNQSKGAMTMEEWAGVRS